MRHPKTDLFHKSANVSSARHGGSKKADSAWANEHFLDTIMPQLSRVAIYGRDLICFIFLITLFYPFVLEAKNSYPNFSAPTHEEIFVVTRGIFKTVQDAKPTEKLLKEVMGKQSTDTLIETDLLEGFPKKQWVLATFFDSEKKARWWMKYSDRNLKLPKMELKKTKLLQEVSHLNYFPESLRGNQKRFFSEQEAIDKVKNLKDIQDLKQQTELNFKITQYPRLDSLNYEVEVLKKNNHGKFVVHDFITLSARDISEMNRFSKP